MVTNTYLFVYGTLFDVGSEPGTYLTNHCSPHGDGKFKGRLYDIGEYPGAVLNSDAGYVFGKIYIMHDAAAALRLFDAYEGFGPKEEQPNLFLRTMIGVETGEGLISCWCYLYNLNVDGLELIESGNYLAYKKTRT